MPPWFPQCMEAFRYVRLRLTDCGRGQTVAIPGSTPQCSLPPWGHILLSARCGAVPGSCPR
eukprot:scaffold42659_cov62-Phaeocystis_antarctica.AAC.13